MKKMRKLLPAIAMLLLSAVLMSTASYAWFSSNITATADNFSVKISAANTLLIKDADGTADYATSIDFDDPSDPLANKEAMAPVSTDNLAVPAFFQLGATQGVTPDNALAGAGSTFVAAEEENYIVKNLLLRATGEAADLGALELTVAATSTKTADSINESLRILVVVTDEADVTATFYINPFGTEVVEPVIKAGNAEDDDTYGAAIDGQITGAGLAGIEIVDNMVAEEEYAVSIYIWFEGQDPSCYANNAVDLEGIDLDFSFTLADASI